MWKDPIVEEVRKARQEHAAKFGYDLDAIFRDLKEQERRGGRKVVSLVPNRPELFGRAPKGRRSPGRSANRHRGAS